MPEGMRLSLLVDARQSPGGQDATLARLRRLLQQEQLPFVQVGGAGATADWHGDGELDLGVAGHWPCFRGPAGLRLVPALEASPGSGPPIGYALDLSDRWLGQPACWTPDEWLQYLLDAFDRHDDEAQEGAAAWMVLLLHPEYCGRAGSIAALEQFLRYVAERDGVGWLPLTATDDEAP